MLKVETQDLFTVEWQNRLGKWGEGLWDRILFGDLDRRGRGLHGISRVHGCIPAFREKRSSRKK
jgi:hypothetical protein